MRAALPQLILVTEGKWIVFSREARLAHHSAREVVRGRDLPGGARLFVHGGELLSQHLHTPILTASRKEQSLLTSCVSEYFMLNSLSFPESPLKFSLQLSSMSSIPSLRSPHLQYTIIQRVPLVRHAAFHRSSISASMFSKYSIIRSSCFSTGQILGERSNSFQFRF